jgi:hypothetical protein
MTITSSLSPRRLVRPPPYTCTVEAKRIVGWALQGVTDQSSFTLFTAPFSNTSSHFRLSPQSLAMVRVNAISLFLHLGYCSRERKKKTILLRGLSRPWKFPSSFSSSFVLYLVPGAYCHFISEYGLCVAAVSLLSRLYPYVFEQSNSIVCWLVCATRRISNSPFTRTFTDFLVSSPCSRRSALFSVTHRLALSESLLRLSTGTPSRVLSINHQSAQDEPTAIFACLLECCCRCYRLCLCLCIVNCSRHNFLLEPAQRTIATKPTL